MAYAHMCVSGECLRSPGHRLNYGWKGIFSFSLIFQLLRSISSHFRCCWLFRSFVCSMARRGRVCMWCNDVLFFLSFVEQTILHFTHISTNSTPKSKQNIIVQHRCERDERRRVKERAGERIHALLFNCLIHTQFWFGFSVFHSM